MRGYVYIAKMGGLYKIGRTKNVQQRMRAFLQLPERLRMVYYFFSDNMVYDEAVLHEAFTHKRKNGEWFALDDQDIMLIKRRYM